MWKFTVRYESMGDAGPKHEKLGRVGSKLAQITKIGLSDGSGGNSIPMTVKRVMFRIVSLYPTTGAIISSD